MMFFFRYDIRSRSDRYYIHGQAVSDYKSPWPFVIADEKDMTFGYNKFVAACTNGAAAKAALTLLSLGEENGESNVKRILACTPLESIGGAEPFFECEYDR